MQLHTEEFRLGGDIADRIEHHLSVFARQPQNQMYDRSDFAFSQRCHGAVKHREVVAAVDSARGFLMDRLQSQLQP